MVVDHIVVFRVVSTDAINRLRHPKQKSRQNRPISAKVRNCAASVQLLIIKPADKILVAANLLGPAVANPEFHVERVADSSFFQLPFELVKPRVPSERPVDHQRFSACFLRRQHAVGVRRVSCHRLLDNAWNPLFKRRNRNLGGLTIVARHQQRIQGLRRKHLTPIGVVLLKIREGLL